MFGKYYKILLLSLIALSIALPFVVRADEDLGLSFTASRVGVINSFKNKVVDLPNMSGMVLGIALSFISVIFFGLMIFGGITWMTAHGNAEQEKSALNTILGAIIGIMIVFGAYAIVKFIFDIPMT